MSFGTGCRVSDHLGSTLPALTKVVPVNSLPMIIIGNDASDMNDPANAERSVEVGGSNDG